MDGAGDGPGRRAHAGDEGQGGQGAGEVLQGGASGRGGSVGWAPGAGRPASAGELLTDKVSMSCISRAMALWKREAYVDRTYTCLAT